MNLRRPLFHYRFLHRVADREDFVETAQLEDLFHRRRGAAHEEPAMFGFREFGQVEQRAQTGGAQVLHGAQVDNQFLIRGGQHIANAFVPLYSFAGTEFVLLPQIGNRRNFAH